MAWLRGELVANSRGKRRDLHQIRRLAAVDGVVDLVGAERGLIGAKGLAKIRKFHAYNRLRHPISSLPACAG